MAEPVPGLKEVDEKAQQILEDVLNIDEKFCRNLDTQTTKKLIRAFHAATGELVASGFVRLEQKLGGHIGGTRK